MSTSFEIFTRLYKCKKSYLNICNVINKFSSLMAPMRCKKPARKSLQLKDFDMEYELIKCLKYPTVVRNLTEEAKRFIKNNSISEDKYFEIYTKIAKRSTNESKEYLRKIGFENPEKILPFFNK